MGNQVGFHVISEREKEREYFILHQDLTVTENKSTCIDFERQSDVTEFKSLYDRWY